jgi:hypothetical protein
MPLSISIEQIRRSVDTGQIPRNQVTDNTP